ncbi:MAG: cation:proton antiporter [Planctomycetes bacterium]|nr:cation:proton antiporter [Planctomycetota bacterium]
MHGEAFFRTAVVYLAAAVLSVPIAKRTGLGSVLGYLLAGALIGPFALDLLPHGETTDVLHFAEFGVVMMLFLIGLELRPRLLWSLRVPIVGLGGLQVVGTTALLGAAALAIGASLREALAIGMVLAMSSTAIVLQSLAEKGLSRSPAGRSAFAVLLFQDLAVIPILALLPLLATHGGATGSAAHDGADGGPGTLAVLATVAAVVVGGRFLSRPVFRFIAEARLREVFTAAALLLVVGIALAMTAVGLSPALGAFLAGVVLADNDYRHELEADIEPFKGLLLGLFFISVGAGIDFGLIGAAPGRLLAIVAVLVVLKLGALLALGAAFRMPLAQSVLFSFALAQGGEFAFVLFSFAQQHGVLGPEQTGPLIAAVAVSMALTPLLMSTEEHLLRPRLARRSRQADDAADLRRPQDEDAPVLLAGFGRFGLVVGRLLRAQGIRTTVLELDPAQIRMLEEFGFQAFYGDASRVELLAAAGAARARLLIVAVDDEEKSLQIVEQAQRHFPHLHILARARGRPHAYALLRRGVRDVFRETLGSSLDLGAAALRALGARAYEAHRAAALFERHDEQSVRELAEHTSGDRKHYVSAARQRSEALEALLLRDRETFARSDDGAWDPPGSRPDGRDA